MSAYDTQQDLARLNGLAAGEVIPLPTAVPELAADAPAQAMRPLDYEAQNLALQQPRPAPTLLRRDDGGCLLYRGKVNAVHGEPEAGKSWLATYAATQTLADGGTVLHLDFDSSADAALALYETLGADRRRLTYVECSGYSRAELDTLLDGRTYDLCLIDNFTDAFTAASRGESSNDADAVAAFMRRLPKRIAATGAAVLLLDHVTKSSEQRGRWAAGSHMKLAGLSGAVYYLEKLRHLAPGQIGSSRLKLSKDRSGGVRRLLQGGKVSADGLTVAGLFQLDSTDPVLSRASIYLPPTDAEHMSEAVSQQVKRIADHLKTARPLRGTRAVREVAGCGTRGTLKGSELLTAGETLGLFQHYYDDGVLVIDRPTAADETDPETEG